MKKVGFAAIHQGNEEMFGHVQGSNNEIWSIIKFNIILYRIKNNWKMMLVACFYKPWKVKDFMVLFHLATKVKMHHVKMGPPDEINAN